MMELHVGKILVPTDLSEQSEAALAAVGPLCEAFEAKLTLLHVTEFAPESYEGPSGGGHPSAEAYRARVKALALEQLEDIRKRHLGDRPHARTAIIDGRVVWKAICDYAEQNGYELIAIATHGHGGLRHALLGSVAERVARHAQCPVMVVRPGAS
jgi:nucleotide-binding universal stress UspA family protein